MAKSLYDPILSPVLTTLLTTALMVFPSVALASSTQLDGQVVDSDGEPIENAQVTLVELDEVHRTDNQGRFTSDNLVEGGLTLLIETDDYDPQWRELDIPAAGDVDITIVIDERPEPVDDGDSGQRRVRTTSASPLENPVHYQPLQTMDQRELQRRSSNSYGEMLDGSPGVAMRSFGPAPSRPVIRGLGGERVLMLHNGERMGDVSSTAHDHHISHDPLSSERVDIIRGPASLLYGSSALGGVVNIQDESIPRAWDEGFFGNAALYGATGQPTGAASATAGWATDSTAYRGRLSHRLAGDMGTPNGTLPDTGMQGTSGDLGASTKTDDGVYGMAVGLHDLTFGLPEEIDSADESVEIRSRRLFTQARADRELSGFFKHLEWRLSAGNYDHEEFEIETGIDGDVEEDLELSYDILWISSSLTAQHGELGPVDRGAFGVQLRGRTIEVGGEEALSPDAGEFSVAMYTFEELPIGEITRLQFGLRPELHLMQPRANERFEAPDQTRASPTLSGSVGIHIAPLSFVELGAQVARAHRAPIVEELYSDAAHLGTGQYEIGDPDLGPEIGYGADTFARIGNDLIETELSGFFNYIDDYIFLDPTGQDHQESGYPIYEYNSANARLFGGEASVLTRPWRDLELRATLGYVRGQRVSPTVEDLPAIPPLRARVETGWNADDLWALLRVRGAGDQNRTAPAEDATGGYALVDIEAGFRLFGGGSHVLTARLDNAFDTTYRDHLSRVRGIQAPMPGRSLHATYRWVY